MKELLKKEGKFEYLELGNGPVLLLLHGLFGALSNWESVINHFKDRFTVVIPMLPIYGSLFRKPTVNNLAEFVHEFVEYKAYDSPLIIGNSLGGHVGLIYAVEHSANYRAMVLTGSSGLFEHGLGGSYPKLGDKNYLKERIEYTFYDPKTATDELIEEVTALIKDRVKVLKIINMSRSAMKQNMAEHLHKIDKPVGLIWGNDDKITPPHVALDFQKHLPDATVYFIDKCGHAPMMEQPEEFNLHFEDFLKKINVMV